MKINKYRNDSALVIALEGRLDTVTAAELEKELQDSLDGVTELIFDFGALEYITSAGLRALLVAYKAMRSKGQMKVTNANDIVKEVFEVTGFNGIVRIE